MSRPFPFRSFSREPAHRRNGKIRAREVRVIDELKKPLGVMALGEALRLAQGRGLDLIEIAPTATPPVCRIMEYGKFQYEESKRKKDSSSRQATNQMKELQLSANIDPHDFQVKLNHAIDFLCEGMKVRVKLRFRGRQRAHKEFGFEIVNRLIKEAAPYGKADTRPQLAGDRDLHVILSPLPREQRAKHPSATPPSGSQKSPGSATARSPKPTGSTATAGSTASAGSTGSSGSIASAGSTEKTGSTSSATTPDDDGSQTLPTAGDRQAGDRQAAGPGSDPNAPAQD